MGQVSPHVSNRKNHPEDKSEIMMKFFRSSLIPLVAFSIFSNNAAAQSSYHGVTITGIVLDPSGASTPDATVTLRQGSSRIRSETR